ncbi:Helitron helicase [Phytophthora megakarya]|uniref:Helitron helicase n=1 Tax=Phytophthora megakarya TaxID=4795 RepID=A0A225UDV6_9STRA|nr:Helitron helicase [Phytophthora megakarya]
MINRGFYEAVDRVVRDIMKNESEPSGGNTIDKFYLYFKTLHARRRKLRALRVQIYEKIYVNSADLAKFSEFLLPIGEGRYPVNEDIGEGVICLPHDMYVFSGATGGAARPW